jgi:hypothetical protein
MPESPHQGQSQEVGAEVGQFHLVPTEFASQSNSLSPRCDGTCRERESESEGFDTQFKQTGSKSTQTRRMGCLPICFNCTLGRAKILCGALAVCPEFLAYVSEGEFTPSSWGKSQPAT